MPRGPALALCAALVVACNGPEPGGAPSGPAAPPTTSPGASMVAGPPTAADLQELRLRLVRVATVDQPVALASHDSSLYIAEKTGRVLALRGSKKTLILDLSAEISSGGEQGLLGLTFSPDGQYLYVNYTDLTGNTHVTEFEVRDGMADLGSRRDVLVVDQPYSNHNGGNLVFGPDGYLYIGLGDGGSGGDPEDRAQDLASLLGKMLRIDPRPTGNRPYGIPPDNPFVKRAGARPEIWAYGLRNPWRYAFDRATGDLWIGDVGQDRREEIDLQPAGEGGRNFGWDGYEGSLVYETPVPDDAVPPIHDFGGELGSSVIGGYVYRGDAIPALQGAYVFGDFFYPVIRALVPSGDRFQEVSLDIKVSNLSSFAEDAAGELYALSLSGEVLRLAP